LWSSPAGNCQDLAPCEDGAWEDPFSYGDLEHAPTVVDHIQAKHAALIPKGPHRGKVLIFGNTRIEQTPNGSPDLKRWMNFWTIIDPESKEVIYTNKFFTLAGEGHIFCAGHSWTAEGNLFVAGGTKLGNDDDHEGAKLAFLFDPSDFSQTNGGSWYRQPDLHRARWYPTVSMNAAGQMHVFGGHGGHHEEGHHQVENNYEIFNPPLSPAMNQGSWEYNANQNAPFFPGPGEGTNCEGLIFYPRIHLLLGGTFFVSGFTSHSLWLSDSTSSTPIWEEITLDASGLAREYGTTILDPLDPNATQATITILGGFLYSTCPNPIVQPPILGQGEATNLVESIMPVGNGAPQTATWSPQPNSLYHREFSNGVSLPDLSLFVVGGLDTNENIVLQPELHIGTLRIPLQSSPYGWEHHSISLFLPTGNVLLTDGDDIHPFDFQIFKPPYQFCNFEFPAYVVPPGANDYSFSYDSNVTHKLEYVLAGDTIQSVLLVRPGSVTHHFDSDQRIIQLDFQTAAGGLLFSEPTNPNLAPPGHYMLFTLTTAGAPSLAGWVFVQ
jgi:galactose oxidase